MNHPPGFRLVLDGLFVTLAFATVLSAQAGTGGYDLAAKVNGIGITLETLEKNFEEYLRENNVNVASIRYPDRFKLMKRETLDLLINQELLSQAAQQQGILATSEEITRVLDEMRGQFSSQQSFQRKLAIEGYTEESYRAHLIRLVSARKYLDKVTTAVEVSDTEIKAFYRENPDKFQLPVLVRARHILVKLAPDADEVTRRAAHEKLAAVLVQARDGADFAKLAGRYSEDASAAQGGDLGYIPSGKMVKPFEDTAFGLKPGEVSDVIETPLGLHIVKLEDRQPARVVPEDQVREQIHAYLLKVKQQVAVGNEVEHLRSGADIEILLPL